MTKKNQDLFNSESRLFYDKIIARAMVNAWAVQQGLFDTLLCETEDPTALLRWQLSLPAITAEVARRKSSGGTFGH